MKNTVKISIAEQIKNRLKPAITWPGAKSKLLAHILPRIPVHRCYVELFCGSLAVLLAKQRSPHEVINDLHGDLVNFYRCVRFHADALLAELEFILISRQEFHDHISQPGLTDIQRAARWFYRNRYGFRGANKKTFHASALTANSSRLSLVKRIAHLSKRLDRVTIENLDWQKCLDLYDRESTFFFLDPPYTHCCAGAYAAWSLDNVQVLKTRLQNLKGSWLLTLNDHPAIRELFADCHMQPLARPLGIRSAAEYKELLISSPSVDFYTAQKVVSCHPSRQTTPDNSLL